MLHRKIVPVGIVGFILLAYSLAAMAEGILADTKARTFSRLAVKPATLSFTMVISAEKQFVIENTGSAPLTLTSILLSTTSAFSIVEAPAPGAIIAPHAESTVTVEFAPSETGKYSGTISIASGATKGKSSAIVKLLGVTQGMIPPSTTPTATATRTPIGSTSATPTATPTPLCPAMGARILSLSPSSAVSGGGGFSMIVEGCNFTSSSKVQWNGSARTTTFKSPNQLNADIAASDIESIGDRLVTVSSNSSASPPATFFVGTTGGAGFAQVVINQESNYLVSDPLNNAIYLSVPGSAPTQGNTISAIDLSSASITNAPFAGSEPDVLAISDDSQFLYAGLNGSSMVQRFTLPTLGTDISYSLGRNQYSGPYFALDLQVAPGSPHTSAVTLGVSGSSPAAQGGITIFDDSTPRPTKAPGFGPGGGGGVLYDSIQWGADTTAMYAANSEDTGFDFYTLTVNSNGIALAHDYSNDFSSFSNRIHFDRGTNLVYADDGHVIDPSTGNPAGAFSYSSPPAVMVPDSSINMAFFLTHSSTTATIQAFNLTQFSLIGSITIPNVSAAPLRLIRWGSNGLAFNTRGGQVCLIGGNFIH